MWKLLGRWCPGKKLDLGPSGSEWDDEAMINRPNGHGPGFVKGVVPMTDAETLDLVQVDQGVIQFRATMKCFVDHQNVGLVGNWIIPSSRSRHNWRGLMYLSCACASTCSVVNLRMVKLFPRQHVSALESVSSADLVPGQGWNVAPTEASDELFMNWADE